MPEQLPGAARAQVTIIELAPGTGAPVAIRFIAALPGFEIGVDPFIVPALGVEVGHTVLVPVESPSGDDAGVLVLLLDNEGFLLQQVPIFLEDLGFKEDVDGTYDFYLGPAIAFYALENPGGDVRGVLAIDADPRDTTDPPGVGAWALLSTDSRELGDVNYQVDWLPALVGGIDPVAYEIGGAARLALPVEGSTGADLVLIDFDPNGAFSPPTWSATSA